MRLTVLTCLALALVGGPLAATASAQSGYLLPRPPEPSAKEPASCDPLHDADCPAVSPSGEAPAAPVPCTNAENTHCAIGSTPVTSAESCAYAAVGTGTCEGEVDAGAAGVWYDVPIPDAYGPVRIALSCSWNGEGGLIPCGW